MDKRGFIRTLEAVIAVILVFVFIYAVSKGARLGDTNLDKMRGIQEGVLRGVSNDDAKRSCIVSLECDVSEYCKVDLAEVGNRPNDDEHCIKRDKILEGIENALPKRYKDRYAFVICSMDDCNIPDLPEENVYTSAVLITSTFEDKRYDPKIVRLWVW